MCAVVKGPALSLDASGNVGDLCYSRWRGMNIARGAWSGTVPNTSLQVASQGKLTTISQLWGGSLTPEQRESWRNAAKAQTWINRVGHPYAPSGYNYFMKLNLKLYQNGHSWILIPPERTLPVKYTDSRCGSSSLGTNNVIRFSDGSQKPTNCDYWEIFRAGVFGSGGYQARDPDYRVLVTNITDYRYRDYAIIDDGWYWYRWRWCTYQGVSGNFHEGQVQAQLF